MPGSIQSIERAAAVLRLLAASPCRLGLAEISASLQLPKGTAHGIIRTLAQVGFVEQDETSKGYQIGEVLGNMSASYLDVNELRSSSMNWADPLASRTGEAVRVGTLIGPEVLVVHYVFSPNASPQRADVGALLPAHATGLGKALLAYFPGAAALMATEMTAYTARTVTDRIQLTDELARTRDRGYAVEFAEYAPDQASIAAPIRGYGGLVVAAVAIHGQADRLCNASGAPRPRMVTRVRDCAEAITGELQIARSG